MTWENCSGKKVELLLIPNNYLLYLYFLLYLVYLMGAPTAALKVLQRCRWPFCLAYAAICCMCSICSISSSQSGSAQQACCCVPNGGRHGNLNTKAGATREVATSSITGHRRPTTKRFETARFGAANRTVTVLGLGA